MSVGSLLILVLVLCLLGVIPIWPHSADWGYGPGGSIGVILLIVVLIVLLR